MMLLIFPFGELALELNLLYRGHEIGGGEQKLMIDSFFNEFFSLRNALINLFHFEHM